MGKNEIERAELERKKKRKYERESGKGERKKTNIERERGDRVELRGNGRGQREIKKQNNFIFQVLKKN